MNMDYRIRAKRTFEVAATGGVCWGVDRAIKGVTKLAQLAAERRNPLPAVLGRLVHNDNSIKKLRAMGVNTIAEAREANGGVVVVTAHGRDPKDISILKQNGFTVLDMTCPIVKDQHSRALMLRELGRKIILVGTLEPHPEIEGTKGVLNGDVIVLDSPFSVDFITFNPNTPIGVIAQTTFDPEIVHEVVVKLKKRFRDVLYFPTVCNDIVLKLQELRERGRMADTVIVVSDQGSANGRHLAETARRMAKTVIFILDHHELTPDMLLETRRIFVTAAASTLDPDIEDVVQKIRNLGWKERKRKNKILTKEKRAQASARQAAGRP
ncbi:MAG: 4-hydroxy-3-methylbut-2-enyl diphosphate reductase [Candidatus Liptonbacteria bacterium]|nr:4-hydroxy-3-methylbut-2-enyl diphosphate reductase [Candidatus Liptonbacteria bacterium]